MAVRTLVATWMALGAACCLACTPAPAPAFGSGLARVPAAPGVEKQERAMFERLNRDRAKNGLAALRFDERLSGVARSHSADMRDHGFFEHQSPTTGGVDNRLDAAGYAFLTARENLSEAPDVESSQDGLLDSPPHHENIMSTDVTHVGIGIVPGGVVDPKNLTVTQVFATPGRDESPPVATKRIIALLQRARATAGLARARHDERLSRLAARHVAETDAARGPESAERLSADVQKAMAELGLDGVSISAQLLPDSSAVVLPGLVVEAEKLSVGVGVLRARSEHGRPVLRVLLLVAEPASSKP